MPIADPDDPRLASYRDVRERDLVGRQGRFIVEGEVTLRAMLSGRARFDLESVLLAHGWNYPETCAARSFWLIVRRPALTPRRLQSTR